MIGILLWWVASTVLVIIISALFEFWNYIRYSMHEFKWPLVPKIIRRLVLLVLLPGILTVLIGGLLLDEIVKRKR